MHERSLSALLSKRSASPAMLMWWLHVQGGVWVLGLIKGGAADRAGVRQGDEILRVNGQEIGPLSPFKVAGLMQGAESNASDDSDTFVDLEVTPHTSAVRCVVHPSGPCLQVAAQVLCRRRRRLGAKLLHSVVECMQRSLM